MTIQEYFQDWSKVVDLPEADATVCPQIKDIFRAFLLCPFYSLRVCIIGQD